MRNKQKIGVGIVGLVLIIVFLGGLNWLIAVSLKKETDAIVRENKPYSIDSALTIIERIQVDQYRYVARPEEKLVASIVEKKDELIELAETAIFSVEQEESESVGIAALYSQVEQKMNEFMQSFDLLRGALEAEEKKRLEFMEKLEASQMLLEQFYLDKEKEHSSLLYLNGEINNFRIVVIEYLALGEKIIAGNVTNLTESIKELDDRHNMIHKMINSNFSKLDQEDRDKFLDITMFFSVFNEFVLKLAKERGSEVSDSKVLPVTEKQKKMALMEIWSKIKWMEKLLYHRIKRSSAVVTILNNEIKNISEVSYSSLKYSINKDPMCKVTAEIQLKGCIELLDELSVQLMAVEDKMKLVDIMNLVYGFRDLMNGWFDIDNKINNELFHESTGRLTEASEVFIEIADIVEESTVQRTSIMTEISSQYGILALAISAFGVFLGIVIVVICNKE